MDAFQFFIHTWVKGHSVTTNRYMTVLAGDSSSKGWYMKCECGKVWAR